MVRILTLMIMTALIAVPACADSERSGDDDFISSTINSVFDKVNEYTSGEKEIISDDARGMNEPVEYNRDALGRKVPASTSGSGDNEPVSEPL